ncbi:hypothetical protein MLD38_039293 [Melastoma candidum]|uniref:Uncharacterized protein n=1 Tax=Melastoma candidum TaxID=119954 RepID=A0ACB9L2C2_9MYRT|nr:hypothetical protein MLD38_039293 [Melastoma candidum]
MISGSSMAAGFGGSSCGDEETEFEVRPGGMLVQKRSDCQAAAVVHHIRVCVAYGSVRHEISVDQQETFGGWKRLLTAKTGLRPEEQKLVFRGRERGDGSYLDASGVKDRSKVVLVQDPLSIEKTYVEMRRDAKIRTTCQAIVDVSVEIEKLAEQVSVVEKSIAKGNKAPEVQITTLIEILMRQAVKLDNIPAEGVAALSKNSQGKKVQACVETLDNLKVTNAKIKPVVVTTTWETFDESPALANKPRRTGLAPSSNKKATAGLRLDSRETGVQTGGQSNQVHATSLNSTLS